MKLANIAAIFILVLPGWIPDVFAQSALKHVQTADGQRQSRTRELVQWTHSRLVFSENLKRVAVGQETILKVEVLGNREVLALAKQVGRTSVMVWYENGKTETFLFSVVEDLSVLRSALKDIHPNIRIELAPDRAALVLRGKVPTIKFRMAAETAARNYLDVGKTKQLDHSDILLQTPLLGSLLKDGNFRVKPPSGDAEHTAAVINLVQVQRLPESTQSKIEKSIRDVGGNHVVIKRVQRSDVPDDNRDTLLLSGRVPNQVVLTRVLNVAARLYLGNDDPQGGAIAVTAIADESGALLSTASAQGGSGASSSLGGIGSRGRGGSGPSGKTSRNAVNSNIARAKMLSIGGGRILSTIEVDDIPQVQVAVQIYEVNRYRLKSWRPDLSVISNDYRKGLLSPALASNGSASPSTIESALQIVGGALSNNWQLGGRDLRFDLLFSLLEQEGIARSVSRPTLTVLAGESAQFRAGGEIPVPAAYSPIGSDSSGGGGVFSATEFKPFGIQLNVKAMVGEDDRITLDINPTVSLPDTRLTQEIAGSTGRQLNTAAFNVRSISTSARLRDGQPLVIGGLVSRDISDDRSFTPGLNRVPLLGKFAESSGESDNDTELVIIVTPTLLRESKNSASLWQYPRMPSLYKRAVQRNSPQNHRSAP